MAPRFSVVVPTYRRAAMLRGLLERLMGQAFPREAFVVIVVDDASPDETPQMLAELQRHWPLRHLRHPANRGQAAGRNWGIREARGHFVAFTDDDCQPPPDWLAHLQRLLEEHPGCAGVGGLQLPIDVRTPASRFWQARADIWAKVGDRPYEVTLGRFVAPGTNNVAYRRDVLLKLGGFCEELRDGEDADLNWRLLEMGERLLLDPSLQVRHHDPETVGQLWRQFTHEGANIFPYLMRRGHRSRALRVAARRFLEPLALLTLAGAFVQPPLAAVPLLYAVLVLLLRRRWLGHASGPGEGVQFALLTLMHEMATSLGFFRGALSYLSRRLSPA
ncbi:MAG: glycosyltransferase [Chloroflexi bacterium]|nr:glycosyltransferase [Chloroflexota bacterium]